MTISGPSTASTVDGSRDAVAERLLERAEKTVVTARKAGRDRLYVAAEWARLHQHQPGVFGKLDETRVNGIPLPAHRWTEIGATKLPVYEYAAAELAVSLQIHPLAAHRLMGDAVDLQARLPHTWAAVTQLRVDDWVARKIVSKTRDLTDDLARVVDAQIADHLGVLPPARLFAVVDARVIEADTKAADEKAAKARTEHGVWPTRPDSRQDSVAVADTAGLFIRGDAAAIHRFTGTIEQVATILAEQITDETIGELRARAVGILADPEGAVEFLAGRDPARGRTTLYVHTTLDQLTGLDNAAGGVARVEDLGPFTRAQLIRLLGHEHITVRPVLDLADQVPADAYEVPASMAEMLHLIKPADVFPHAQSLARGLDHDHTVPYGDPKDGAPPGQTRIDNLGKMTRRHHRVKTHAPGWVLTQLPGNRYLWATPHGRYRMTDSAGTHLVDDGTGRRPTVIEIYRADVVLAS